MSVAPSPKTQRTGEIFIDSSNSHLANNTAKFITATDDRDKALHAYKRNIFLLQIFTLMFLL